MSKLKVEGTVNLNEVFLLTEAQAKQRYNIGTCNLFEIANQAGAIVRIGVKKCYSRQKMDEWFLRHTE